MATIYGTSIRCDCCGKEKLAEIHPHLDLEIIDGRHGIRHTVTLSPQEILEGLAGTKGRDAVLRYVASILVT